MNEEQADRRRAEWDMILGEMDLNGDGTISREEILTAMQLCGQNPTNEEIENMFGAGSLDDGKVTFEEYFACMEGMPDPAENLREALDVFTEHASEDGRISKEKLREVLLKEVPEEDANDLLDNADENGDGEIDKDEFIKLILNPSYKDM